MERSASPRPIWTDEEWAAKHAGVCGAGTTPCGQPGRLYPCGWRCDDHRPTSDPGVTLPDQAAGVAPTA